MRIHSAHVFSNTISHKLPISVNPSPNVRVYQWNGVFFTQPTYDGSHQRVQDVLRAQATMYHKDRVIDHCTKWKMLESFRKELKQLLNLKGKVSAHFFTKKKLAIFFGAAQKKKHYGLQPFLCRLNVQKTRNSERILASGFSCFKDRDLAASLCQYCPQKSNASNYLLVLCLPYSSNSSICEPKQKNREVTRIKCASWKP